MGVRLRSIVVVVSLFLYSTFTLATHEAKNQPTPFHGQVPAEYQKWHNLGPGGGGSFRTMRFSPHENKLLVGGDNAGILVSSNDYRRFTAQNYELMNPGILEIVYHPTDPNIIYLGTKGGVARSADGGGTWTMLRGSGFPAVQSRPRKPSTPIYGLALDPHDTAKIYAGIGYDVDLNYAQESNITAELGKVFISEDGGGSWQEENINPGGTDFITRGRMINAIRTDACTGNAGTSADIFVLGEKGIYRRNGSGWQQIPHPANLSQIDVDNANFRYRDIQIFNSTTWFLSYSQPNGSSYRSVILFTEDAGNNWRTIHELSTVKSESGFYRLVLPPSVSDPCLTTTPLPQMVYGAERDHGVYKYTSTDGWNSSIAILKLNPVNASKFPNDQDVWYGVTQRAIGFSIDPNNQQVMAYCDATKIYLSTNGGDTWEQVVSDYVVRGDGVQNSTFTTTGVDNTVVETLAIDYSSPKNLYIGYLDTALWRSRDAGQSHEWLEDLPTNYWGDVHIVTLDPAYPDVIYASYGLNQKGQKLYRSTDGGDTFIEIGGPSNGLGFESNGLGRGYITDIVIDPNSPPTNRTLYVSIRRGDENVPDTDNQGYGVFRSTDHGVSWQSIHNDLAVTNTSVSPYADSNSYNVIDLELVNTDAGPVLYACAEQQNGATGHAGYVARTLNPGSTSPQNPVSWLKLTDAFASTNNIHGIDCGSIVADTIDPYTVYALSSNARRWNYHDRTFLRIRPTSGGFDFHAVPALNNFDVNLNPAFKGVDGWVYLEGSLAVDPATPGRLYLALQSSYKDYAMGIGLFVSNDYGDTWSTFDITGLPTMNVARIIVDPYDTSRLYALTNGSGLWRYGAPPPDSIDIDNDGVYDNTDNCVDTPNAGQEDIDNDGLGDACDPTNGNIQATLTVNSKGTGTGVVTSVPAGIDCGAYCTATYDGNQVVSLTATAANDSVFDAWVGCSPELATTCSVTMDESKSVSVLFRRTMSVWFDDSLPSGATPGSAWLWGSTGPTPRSGSYTFVTPNAQGTHGNYFDGSQEAIVPGLGESLFAYVYLDPNAMPEQIMLAWRDVGTGGGWHHRAYWGANRISAGEDGTDSRRYMGPLPNPGEWVRLEVPASAVGLEHRPITGMSFTLYGGMAYWDYAGKLLSTDSLWFDDGLPSGAGGTVSNWVSSDPAPLSGVSAFQTNLSTGKHEYYFDGSNPSQNPAVDESLFVYVYLDPQNPPQEVMLAWRDVGTGENWNHRAYWGADMIGYGQNGTVTRRYMGPLPPLGKWVRLEVPASAVGLEGRTVTGMSFSLFDGRATWDYAGKAKRTLPPIPAWP